MAAATSRGAKKIPTPTTPLIPRASRLGRPRGFRSACAEPSGRSCTVAASALARLRGPRILEGDGSVHDELPLRRLPIDTEVADALELKPLFGNGAREARLDAAVGHHFERAPVEQCLPVDILVAERVFDAKEPVVEPRLG